MNKYNPLNFRINRELELLETFDGERFVPLGTSSVVVNHLKEYDNATQEKQYIGYRDLYEHPDYINEVTQRGEQFTPRGYHYISAFQKYIGWYYYHKVYLKTGGYHTFRKFHTPLISKLSGSGKTIETITKTDHTNALGADGEDVMLTYELTFTDSSMDYVKPATSDEPGKHIVTKPLSPSNAPWSVQQYPVIATELGNQSWDNTRTPKPFTEIIMMRIDCNFVPKGCYFRYSHMLSSAEGGQNRLKVRTLKINTNKLEVSGDYVYANYASQIDEYQQTESRTGRLPVTGYTVSKENGDMDYILHKLERPQERYTYLVAEYTSNINNKLDSSTGLLFNMFVPEQKVGEYVRGINETQYTFIKNFDKVGKLWNTSSVSLSDYKYFPTFPKQGDIITVVDDVEYEIT